MLDYLIHANRKGADPFRSLSALSDAEAIQVMKDLYLPDSVFWERFEDPAGYLRARRQVEEWLRRDFTAKGGKITEPQPVYMIYGRSRWLQTMLDAPTLATTVELIIPLAIFEEDEVSFTYPDSMISWLLASQREPGIYLPDYHGRVFTLPEMRSIVVENGLPGERWGHLPDSIPNYIEAQVWDRAPLHTHLERLRAGDKDADGPNPGHA